MSQHLVAERGFSTNTETNLTRDEILALDLELSDSDYFLSDVDSPSKNIKNNLMSLPQKPTNIHAHAIKRPYSKTPSKRIKASSEAIKRYTSSSQYQNAISWKEKIQLNQQNSNINPFSSIQKIQNVNNKEIIQPKRSIPIKEYFTRKQQLVKSESTNTVIAANSNPTPIKRQFVSVATSPIKFPSPLCKCKRQNRARNHKKRELAKRALQFAKQHSTEFNTVKFRSPLQ